MNLTLLSTGTSLEVTQATEDLRAENSGLLKELEELGAETPPMSKDGRPIRRLEGPNGLFFQHDQTKKYILC